MVAVLRSLSLGQRFAILAIAAAGLVAAPMWHSLQAQWSALAFTQAASAAITPLENATAVLAQLQRHRGSAGIGSPAQPPEGTGRAPSAQETRARLREQRQQLELAGLQASARRAADIASGFELVVAASQRAATPGQTLREQHAALVEDQLRLIEGLAEEAGLTRVADPAHREIVAAATRDPPRSLDALARWRAQAEARPAADEPAAPVAAAPLQWLAAEAEALHNRAQARLGRAAQQPAAAAVLAGAPAASRASLEAALGAARRDADAERAGAEPARRQTLLQPAIDAQSALVGKALAALRDGLQQEWAQQQAGMTTALGGITLLAGFVLALGLACVRSVQRPLREAIAAARAAQLGHLGLPAASGARDELEELLDTLRQAQERLQRQQQEQGQRLVEAEAQQRVAAQVSAEIGDLADRAARGDFTGRLPLQARHVFQAELCSRINQLLDTVGLSLARAQQLAGPLADLAAQASRTARALSSETAEGAADAAGAAQALNPLAASARQMADRARTTGSHVAQAADKAREGGLAVGRTASTTRSIAERASEVDDIAYQAHLVALNATLDASRATPDTAAATAEPAAAAEELRELSRRGKAAAHELATLSVQASGHAEHASERLLSIGPGIERARDLVQQIATAASTQAEAVEQVGASLRQLAGTTQRQGEAAGQLAGSAEKMHAQAAALRQCVEGYKVPAAPVPLSLPAPGAATAKVRSRSTGAPVTA